MEKLSRIHVKSFDFMLRDGLKRMIKYLPPSEFSSPNGDVCELRVEFLELSNPIASDRNTPIYPHECRRQGKSYCAPLRLNIRLSINGTPASVLDVPCGEIPIMVLSRSCNLSKLNRKDFPRHSEEEREIGGYFIVNGKERVLRLIIMARRNFPLAVSRLSFKKRGHGYTEQAIVIRCVREDEAVSVRCLIIFCGEILLAFL
ncbi:hypothetical protein PHET_12044 [Paragonimus heterotremus]|uniref:DNA-directed RNA polymerase n=1 Tax=Paragonimus heterotremus TaxID=100268 RepID=A0A8J4SST7_9TREM|nr:hypothetical protein PHET_12044 [Paragonimus heterotremus]